jgi:hypothetical protein
MKMIENAMAQGNSGKPKCFSVQGVAMLFTFLVSVFSVCFRGQK